MEVILSPPCQVHWFLC